MPGHESSGSGRVSFGQVGLGRALFSRFPLFSSFPLFSPFCLSADTFEHTAHGDPFPEEAHREKDVFFRVLRSFLTVLSSLFTVLRSLFTVLSSLFLFSAFPLFRDFSAGSGSSD